MYLAPSLRVVKPFPTFLVFSKSKNIKIDLLKRFCPHAPVNDDLINNF